MPSWGSWALRQSLRSPVFRSLVPKLKNSATSAILSASKGCARDFDHRAEHVLHTLGLGGLDDGRHLHVQNILVELFAAVLDRLSPAPMVEPQTHAREVRERVSYCDACCARGGPRQIESRPLTYSRFVLLIIGSAVADIACFACITGSANPDDDLELDVTKPLE